MLDSLILNKSVMFLEWDKRLNVYYTSPKIIRLSYSLALQTWGLLMNLDWLVHLIQCPNVSTFDCNCTEWSILCIIIGDVHQFIGLCLIFLDP